MAPSSQCMGGVHTLGFFRAASHVSACTIVIDSQHAVLLVRTSAAKLVQLRNVLDSAAQPAASPLRLTGSRTHVPSGGVAPLVC